MIEVIRKGIKNRIKCDYCRAFLAYNKDDIQKEEQCFGPYTYNIIKYITCPECKNKIVIRGTR